MPVTSKCPPPLPDHLAVPKDWMSPQELAEWLNVPIRSVYVWNQNRTGPKPTRWGKHVRYSRNSILQFLAAQEVPE